MTFTTWLLVFGSLMVAAIVIDGMRRMFASHTALSINIDETLCGLPEEEYTSELPNGGARIINAGLEPAKLDLEEPCIEDSFDELTLDVQFEDAAVEMPAASVEELAEDLAEELAEELDESPVIEEDVLHLPDTITLDSNANDAYDDRDDRDDRDDITNITHSFDTLSTEDTFDLDASPLSITTQEISVSTTEIEHANIAYDSVPDAAAPTLDFDPTRPVHEWVETNSIVPRDLLAAQNLTASATVTSQVPHSFVETSDDILFSDTGIEEFTTNGESLVSPSQDESLSTKLAKVTSLTFGRKLLNRRRVAEQVTTDLTLVEEETNNVPVVEQVISVLVSANKSQGFYGPGLLQLIKGCGLVYGDMNIFHRFEDGLRLGKTQFSMANMMEPGTFDLTQMDQLHTPGVVFFLSLPTAQDSMQAFEYMFETAQCLASNLDGDLLDEQHSVMRPQTIEHCRQQIREFERRHMTRRPQF